MEIIGKVQGINTSDGKLNVTVEAIDKVYNIKVLREQKFNIEIGLIYQFVCDINEGSRTTYFLRELNNIESLPLAKKDPVLRHYLPSSEIDSNTCVNKINSYISKIDNKILNDITKGLVNKFYDLLFTYPAATKMHHAYVGGLAYHVIGMLDMAEGFLTTYPYLNKDYLYAGIILHDIGKTIEFTGNQNTEYSLPGQLLGHITIGVIEIALMAEKLGVSNTKEVLYLEHMILSHHGQPAYGSVKKPMFAEAIALSFIDNVDSKFRVLGEELDATEDESFTDPIGVLERMKAYKIKY